MRRLLKTLDAKVRSFIPLHFVDEELKNEVVWDSKNRLLKNRKKAILCKSYSPKNGNNILNVSYEYT